MMIETERLILRPFREGNATLKKNWRKYELTNQDIRNIALQQSAYDCNCTAEDFLKEQNVVTISREHPLARKYLKFPMSCDLVSYGSNIVAQTSPELAPFVQKYIDRYPVEHCFETPNMHVLDELLRPFGQKICFMAEYFLPDVDALRELPCDYELRVLYQQDFASLYLPQWSNALCEKRKQLDVLGVGAYDNGKLIGLAGCSADCEQMYQIGVDVLPEYRRKGIASALTSRLSLEILALGKVPFYCAAWCNIKSVRNAIRSGFRPAWVEITAKSIGYHSCFSGIRISPCPLKRTSLHGKNRNGFALGRRSFSRIRTNPYYGAGYRSCPSIY